MAFSTKITLLLTVAITPLIFFSLVITQIEGLNDTILLNFILQIWLFGILVILTTSFVYFLIYTKIYKYEFKEHVFTIKKGVLFPTENIIEYKKIKTIFSRQDIFDKLFKLYQVKILTSNGTRGEDVTLDGLEKNDTTAFIETLLKMIKKENETS